MLPLVSCGIFQYELEKILPEIERELGQKIDLTLLSPALDVSDPKLEQALTEGSAPFKHCAWLYGSMCHSAMPRLAETAGAVFPKQANCMEIFLGAQKKKELDATGNFYYLSSGGLQMWRRIYQEQRGWDEADGRMNFGYFEKVIVLDTGIGEITDEALFEFFDFAQIPVEVVAITLEPFKAVLRALCQAALSAS